jgi:hypothetical protein
MPAEHEHICGKCGTPTHRDLLTVKKVLFVEMGAGGKTIRSRVDSWLCPPCTKTDPHWLLPSHRQPEERPRVMPDSGVA